LGEGVQRSLRKAKLESRAEIRWLIKNNPGLWKEDIDDYQLHRQIRDSTFVWGQ